MLNWENKVLTQQPNWPNIKQFQSIIHTIEDYPNLVSVSEIHSLKHQLAQAAQGDGFILQGGDCAETFSEFSNNMIKNKLKVLLQMSAIIQYITKTNVIKIGRIAGQFFKPRSLEFETHNNLTLPVYRGDAINGIQFSDIDRTPNPKRLLQAYHQSSSIMNLIRNLTMEGFTNFSSINSWDLSLQEQSQYVKKYNVIAKQINEMMIFANASNDFFSSNIHHNAVYTSHEALLLDYEAAFAKNYLNKTYICSAHMLWIGDRTRFIDSAHIHFASQISNPIGIKIGPNISIKDIIQLCQKINPQNNYGKISLIIRLGINYINEILPQLIKEVVKNKINVLWLCDPMHGNTIQTESGLKTRDFATIKEEIEYFFNIHNHHNTIPGGVHFELTGDNVTECIGGIKNIKDNDLTEHYQTACDPRLNNEQSLEMGFLIAELLQKRRINK
jgi:3-deoxy-7-phosphoheptulonate synthase